MTERTHLTWVAALATFLTSLSLTTLLREQSWLLPAVAQIVLVALVGFAARRLRFAPLLTAAVQLVVAFGVVIYQFAGADTRRWGLPTLESLRRLGELASGGRASIQQFAAPILPDDGVTFLLVVGVAAIAVAVDLFAVGLRAAPVAGLPLLALYTVPIAAAPDGVPWFLFVLAAGAYVGLLIADGRDRLQRWGRTMGFSARDSDRPEYDHDVETAPVARIGRRVGAAAIGLAVLLPAALPAMNGSLFGGGNGPGGSGGRSVLTSDPIVDLNRDLRQPKDVPVFTYTTTDPAPDYLRAVTLDQFDGNEWTQSDRRIPDEQIATEGMPTAPGISSRLDETEETTKVDVLGTLEWRWLPVPYPVVSLSTTGRWVYDAESLNIFGVSRTTAGLGYEVKSWRVAYDPSIAGTTVPPIVRPYLQLPNDLPAEVRTLAESVTAGSDSPFAKAIALQEWFRDPRQFTYTLARDPGHSNSALLDFLNGREGYCEQFAATMAIMSRVLGIPARVDVGFTPGEKTGPNKWTVTTHDAHSWPELYFENLGWVRFEPTPAARTGAAPDWTDSFVAAPGATPTVSPSGGQGGSATVAPPNERGLEGLGIDSGGQSGFQFPTVPVIFAGGLLLLVFLPRILRLFMTRIAWRRARTDNDLVLTGWRRVLDDAGDLGFDWDMADTPRTIATGLRREAGLLGDSSDALVRLATATERVLYAATPGPVPAVRGDVTTVTTALRGAVERSARWRAFFLPRSSARVGRAISEALADAMDWVDSVTARLRFSRTRST